MATKRTRSRYDEVFTSSPSEDIYREIFSDFHASASSIPVLDLPPVNENNALFDLGLVDYSEVFGGFVMDYAAPFHQLFSLSNGGNDFSSCDDDWTPVETECLSEEWEGSSYSSKRKSFEIGSNQESVEDGGQFNMSYLRKHQMNESVSNAAHVAPVHVVSGYSVVSDQIHPYQNTVSQNPQLSVDDKLVITGKHEDKIILNKVAPYFDSVEHEKIDVRNGSDDMFITISEINLRTQPSHDPPPSRPPPIYDVKHRNTSQRATSYLLDTCSSEHFLRSISGKDIPPFVDVELAGRFASADFTLTTESVNKSQALLKTIQENMHNKSVFGREVNICAKDGTKCNVALRKSQISCDDLIHPPAKEYCITSNSAQSSPECMGENGMLHLSGNGRNKQSWSLVDSCESRSSGEWVEVPEFIELLRSDKTKTLRQKNVAKIIVRNKINESGKEERSIPKHEDKILKQASNTRNKSEDTKAMNNVILQYEKYDEVLVLLHTEHQNEEVEEKVHKEGMQKENDTFINILKNEHDIEKEMDNLAQKMKFDKEIMKEVGPKESFVTAEDGQIIRKCEIRLRCLNEQALCEIREDAHIEQQIETVMNTKIVEEKQVHSLTEAFGDDENYKKQKKSNENNQREQPQETKITSTDISEKEENERQKQEEMYVAKLMEASENEAEDMLKEAIEEVNKRILMEDFERAERENKMENDAEQPHNQENLDQLSRCNNMMSEHTDEKEPNATNKINMDPYVGFGGEATNHCSSYSGKIIEEHGKVINSVCEADEDNTHEPVSVSGKRSNCMQTLDDAGKINVIGTHEYLSATKENATLLKTTYMHGNSSGETSLTDDQIGVKINCKVPCMGPGSGNLHEKIEAQARTNMASHDEVDINKHKLGQKTEREMTHIRRSDLTNFYKSDGITQTHNLSQQRKTSQIGGKENRRNDGIQSEERAKLERESELERLWEMEEEWEREREREKDRVAFESVTRSVREDSYDGLRERASVNGASTDESRQTELAKARERLEKSCLEANEKLYSDKVSMDAMMRRDQGRRPNSDATEHAAQSPRARYPTTSVYYSKAGAGGLEGETVQRCKARLERHTRTAERAAKALVEKNTRDLIALREQAERHRLAEALDAEVKRWANGKQGNIRALLSTLQYILGAESAWQPVPLTDIITSVSVKKAYRKATLCVHPDKLQQRRATIRQKYTCEKVFDLLKDAWNRFNSEER